MVFERDKMFIRKITSELLKQEEQTNHAKKLIDEIEINCALLVTAFVAFSFNMNEKVRFSVNFSQTEQNFVGQIETGLKWAEMKR